MLMLIQLLDLSYILVQNLNTSNVNVNHYFVDDNDIYRIVFKYI